MLKTKKICMTLLVFLLFSCNIFRNEKPPRKTENVGFEAFIEQNGTNINGLNDFYTIEDRKFNILVNNVNDKTICIFAYHSEEMFTKYSYPVKCENTVIFHPATALIDSANANKEITLTINREMQHNVITPEKRTNSNGTAVIKIKDIADTDDKFNGMLYLTIFVDFNKNDIIENNEIKNIYIKINKSDNSILFRARIYVSTIGSRIREINYPVYSDEYFYVKITNEKEKQMFLQLFGQNNFSNTYSTINRIINLDYTKYNMYVIFSPITEQIELYGNPYHYKGENRLIFKKTINRKSNIGKYVFCREYYVEKNKDIFEIWITDNEELRKLKEIEL
jgi:hypothetical protein